MSAEIIDLDIPTLVDLAPIYLRDRIPWDDLEHVVVLAYDKNEEFLSYGNSSDVARAIYMMHKFIHQMMQE